MRAPSSGRYGSELAIFGSLAILAVVGLGYIVGCRDPMEIPKQPRMMLGKKVAL